VLAGLRHKYDDPQPLSPLTHFIGSLWAKLAINDRTLTPLADVLRITNTYPVSGSLAFESYKLADVTTPQIIQTSDESSQLVPTGITCTSSRSIRLRTGKVLRLLVRGGRMECSRPIQHPG